MSGETPPAIFDHELLRKRLHRAIPGHPLMEDTAAQLSERLGEIKCTFESALDLSLLPFLPHARKPDAASAERLPYPRESFDLIAANLGLHWVNDLPGFLAQIRSALKPGGLFIASLIGGASLCELRECLLEAEIHVLGGASPRISPMIDLRTAGDLLRRAKFSLPVADVETITFLYKDLFALMRDLRAMGQTNVLTNRLRRFTSRKVFFETNEIYRKRHHTPEGLIPATFEIIYLHGWKPAIS